jgi:hypothetical protein
MTVSSTIQDHLKALAKEYRDHHLVLQKRYQETSSADDFVAELRRRESALVDRFRLVQINLLGLLQGEHLNLMLDLSRIFDEMRVVNSFAVQVLSETRGTWSSEAQDDQEA